MMDILNLKQTSTLRPVALDGKMINKPYYNLVIYRSAIHAALLSCKLSKYANSPKLLAILDKLNVPDDVRNFVIGQPSDQQGFSVGQINKKKNITVIELQNAWQAFREKEELKTSTKEDLSKQIDKGVSEPTKNWIIIQLKKFPKEHKFLIEFCTEIDWFAEKYGLDLASYDAQGMRQAMHHAKFLNEEEVSQFGLTNSSLDIFFHNMIVTEDALIERLEEYRARIWVQKQFFRIRREWRHNIEKVMKSQNKTFEQLLQEGKAIMDAQQAGQLRGQEMPHTPLHNAEHSLLMTKAEAIADWALYAEIGRDEGGVYNGGDAIAKMSLRDVVERSDRWHEEESKKGKGKAYDPLDRSNIVYGPDNWADEENKGYFILELKSDNDLKTEGSKMNHCVGGYCDARNTGKTRIFSLRNDAAPEDPILTIETDPSAAIIRQDYGPNNSKIDNKFHKMIEEWNQKSAIEIDLSKLSIVDLSKLTNKCKEPELLEKISDFIINTWPGESSTILSITDNQNTSGPTLQKIYDFYNKKLEFKIIPALIRNRNTPDEILISIIDDLVTHNTQRNINMLTSIVLNRSDRKNILKHISDNIRHDLNNGDTQRIDTLIDVVTTTDEEKLEKYFTKNPTNESIVKLILRNRATPTYLIEWIHEYHTTNHVFDDIIIAFETIKNPNTPIDILKFWANRDNGRLIPGYDNIQDKAIAALRARGIEVKASTKIVESAFLEASILLAERTSSKFKLTN